MQTRFSVMTAPNPLVEAYFLPWSVSLSSDAPYWRPPSRALSVVFSRSDGLEARFWGAICSDEWLWNYSRHYDRGMDRFGPH